MVRPAEARQPQYASSWEDYSPGKGNGISGFAGVGSGTPVVFCTCFRRREGFVCTRTLFLVNSRLPVDPYEAGCIQVVVVVKDEGVSVTYTCMISQMISNPPISRVQYRLQSRVQRLWGLEVSLSIAYALPLGAS